MALRNQPYLPLYIQDYLTDEKLNECSAASQGIYIKLMCLMHKSEEYGVLILNQKNKQSEDFIENFTTKLVKHLPFLYKEIYDALMDLLEQKVIERKGDKLLQTRMVKDNKISLMRSKAGKKGGDKSYFAQAKHQAKHQAKAKQNTEYEYEDETVKEKITTKLIHPTVIQVKEYCLDNKYNVDAEKFVNFYESKGWMIGKNKMKNWQAAVRTWGKNYIEKPKRSAKMEKLLKAEEE